ncbi:McrC family protein [Methylobacterium oryzihabitans]|uniref:Restriction endonuclease n=1 Tax=Methylobacterium oryzihabitans TaxID=2499852 RepID=A0A437NVU6_9HYPH|nr:restriction endonuclease [Methylobacterium oryzihabitans]RVU14002.1 restriction endonuclease [Methylobacterium oryzihabitans]
MIRRTLREWEYLPVSASADETGVTRDQADRLLAAARRTSLGGSDGERVLVDGGRRLRAQQVVGILVADGVTLEILPKIDADAATTRASLVHMLAVVYDLEIAAGPSTDLGWQSRDLIDILIQLFCDKLAAVLRRGLPRAYLRREGDLGALRGRLDVTRQCTVLAVSPQLLACRYEDLEGDIALNRVLKATLVHLAALARASETRRRLRELLFVYDEVALPARAALPSSEIVLDRSNAPWREVLGFARLLLGDRFQTTSAGEARGFALLFEMNTLFEEFVGRTLRRALAGSGASVSLQGPRRHALVDLARENSPVFATRPDILVSWKDGLTTVLDTKWKRLTDRTEDTRRGVGQADIYQLMAYAQVYECCNLILIYPHHIGLPMPAGRLADYGIVKPDGACLTLLTIDLAAPNTIRDHLRAQVTSPRV